MNAQLLPRQSWLVLSLLGVGYALLGWYLAAHHVFWLVSAFIVVTTLTIAWKSNPVLESLVRLIRRTVFVVISGSLLFSLVVALIFVNPTLLSLIPLLLVTLTYALLEMQTAGFKQTEVFIWSVVITGLGLGLGEIIDLFFAPSMRY
jgi:hypothetical protein